MRKGPDEDAYEQLCAYTLEHARRDRSFIHQHVVDAWAAQQADAASKPISVVFALVGLYLHLERQVTGRDVQRAHVRLARRKGNLPSYALPDDRGSMTAADVMKAPPGPERDRTIDAWCASVWKAFIGNRTAIVEYLRQHGIE